MTPLERVVEVLEAVTPNYIDEYTLQAQLADALEHAHIHAEREVRLSDGISRIDILAIVDDSTVGVEVKIDGSGADVARQVSRYARLPDLDAVVLVTTRSRHHHLPAEISGTPVRLVSYVTAGL